MCNKTSYWCLRGSKFCMLSLVSSANLLGWLLPFGRQENWAMEHLSPWPKATGLIQTQVCVPNPSVFPPSWSPAERGQGEWNLSSEESFLCSCLHMKHYFPFYFEPCLSASKRFIMAGCFLPAKSIELNCKHCLAFCRCSYLLRGGWFLVSILSRQWTAPSRPWEDIEGRQGKVI